jgi:hypothetical protein
MPCSRARHDPAAAGLLRQLARSFQMIERGASRGP